MKLTPSGRVDWRLVIAIGAPALLAVLANAQYVSDEPLGGLDMPFIVPRLAEAGGREVLGWWTGDWVQGNGYYRPLVSLSFWLDYQCFGPDRAALWRWHNVVLLAVGTALVGLLVWVATGSRAGACCAGLVAVEGFAYPGAVMWIAPRTDLLCGLWYLLATALAWRYGQEGHDRLLIGAILAAGLALAAKEMALTLAVMLPVAVWLAGGQVRRVRPTAAAAGLLVFLWWLLRSWALGTSPLAPAIHSHPAGLLSKLEPWLVLLFPPIQDLRLIVQLPAVGWLAPPPWLRLGHIAVHLTALVLLWRHGRRWLWFYLAWKAVVYLPALPYRLLGSHYYYLPQMGDAWLLGCAVAVAWPAVRGRYLVGRLPCPDGSDGLCCIAPEGPCSLGSGQNR